jgi:hypothetical protein
MPLILKTSVDYSVSWTSICNGALGRLGSASIVDLSEGTINAELCTRFLPRAVEHVLDQYDFNFSRKRSLLSPLVKRPEFGGGKIFPLPVDLLRVTGVYGGDGVSPLPYRIEGDALLADADEAALLYIARPLTPRRFPSYVTNALVAYLAFLLSSVVTSSEQMVMLMRQDSAELIEKAKRLDAAQNWAPEDAGEPFYGEARK